MTCKATQYRKTRAAEEKKALETLHLKDVKARRTWIKNHSLDQAESFYRAGRISQSDYEWYCYHWRNLTPRFSSLCESYEDRRYPGFYYSYPGDTDLEYSAREIYKRAWRFQRSRDVTIDFNDYLEIWKLEAAWDELVAINKRAAQAAILSLWARNPA